MSKYRPVLPRGVPTLPPLQSLLDPVYRISERATGEKVRASKPAPGQKAATAQVKGRGAAVRRKG
jgi:hypothetical protein